MNNKSNLKSKALKQSLSRLSEEMAKSSLKNDYCNSNSSLTKESLGRSRELNKIPERKGQGIINNHHFT